MDPYQLDILILESSVHFSDKKNSNFPNFFGFLICSIYGCKVASNLKKEDAFFHDFSYLTFFYMNTEELHIARYLLPINLASKFVQYMYSNRLFFSPKIWFFHAACSYADDMDSQLINANKLSSLR